MDLDKNQILITFSKDKEELTIQCGTLPARTYDVSPNNIISCIGRSIKAYDEYFGLTRYEPEWAPNRYCCDEIEHCNG